MSTKYTATIDVISKPATEVSADTAELLDEVHPALANLPGDRAANVDHPDLEAVKTFLKEAKAHAEKRGWRFTRVGDIKGQPLRTSFRVVTRKTTDTVTEGNDAAGTVAAADSAPSVAGKLPAAS